MPRATAKSSGASKLGSRGEPMTAFVDIDMLTGGRLGTFDVPCPVCGPNKRSPSNRRRPVLRIWRIEPSFASFHCARCGEKGYTQDGHAPKLDPAKLAKARTEAMARERVAVIERQRVAGWLWSRRHPIAGSVGEIYLRRARGYGGPLPATLGFLPPRDNYPPAMIAAFGMATEPEPGNLTIVETAVQGVHITRLKPDGSGRLGIEGAKIMIGHSVGMPIMLAPTNDLLGLAIAEGIEDALSAHQATGLGAWAAGCAARLPALASVLPDYVECVTILVDDDKDGRRHAARLGELIAAKGYDVRPINLGSVS
jgi:hypothetical protein